MILLSPRVFSARHHETKHFYVKVICACDAFRTLFNFYNHFFINDCVSHVRLKYCLATFSTGVKKEMNDVLVLLCGLTSFTMLVSGMST